MWIKKNTLLLIGAVIAFVFLVKNGTIPSDFSVTTFSLFGGGVATISIGVVLLIGGFLALFFAPATGGLSAILTPIFFIGAWLIAGGAIITTAVLFFKSITGILIIGVSLLAIFLLKKR